MSEEDASKLRLERAVARLEAAVSPLLDRGANAAADAAQDGPRTSELESEIVALRSECARLKQQLQDARQEYSALQDVTDAVATRLDAAIGELRATVGS